MTASATNMGDLNFTAAHIKKEAIPTATSISDALSPFYLSSSSESTAAPHPSSEAIHAHYALMNQNLPDGGGLIFNDLMCPVGERSSLSLANENLDVIDTKWWHENRLIPTDPSMLYRWADGSALMRAKAERIYKPSNKQEWRAVYWLLVPSTIHPTVEDNNRPMNEDGRLPLTPPSLSLRKFRRRQCSFSCLKYGEEGARQRAKLVLDFVNMTGFLPPNLKGNSNQNRRERGNVRPKRESIWPTSFKERRGKRPRADPYLSASPFASWSDSEEDLHSTPQMPVVFAPPRHLCCSSATSQCPPSSLLGSIGHPVIDTLPAVETPSADTNPIWDRLVSADGQCGPGPSAADSCLGIFDTMLASAPPAVCSAEEFHFDWFHAAGDSSQDCVAP